MLTRALSVPVLPLETLEEIIDHLYSDTTALASCSLASRVLLPSTRHHLFSEVVLRVYSMDILLDILDAPWTSIAPAIRDLVVAGRGPISAFTVDAAYRTIRSKLALGMQRIIANLQNVQCVRLQRILWDEPTSEVATMLCSLKGVTELRFYSGTFLSVDDFKRYICSYPALQVLSSYRLDIPESPASEMDCGRMMIQVSHLDLQYSLNHRGILDFLLSLDAVPPVHRLSIDQKSQIPLLSQFVRKAGSSVQRLDVTFDIDGIPEGFVDFSPLRNLRILRISGLRADTEPEARDLIKVIVSQISSTRLTELSLGLHLNSIPWKGHYLLENYGWSGVPQLLLQPPFTDIQKISITLSGFRHHHNWDSELMTRLVRRGPFSVFDDRGILEVHFIPTPPRSKATAGRPRRRVDYKLYTSFMRSNRYQITLVLSLIGDATHSNLSYWHLNRPIRCRLDNYATLGTEVVPRRGVL